MIQRNPLMYLIVMEQAQRLSVPAIRDGAISAFLGTRDWELLNSVQTLTTHPDHAVPNAFLVKLAKSGDRKVAMGVNAGAYLARFGVTDYARCSQARFERLFRVHTDSIMYRRGKRLTAAESVMQEYGECCAVENLGQFWPETTFFELANNSDADEAAVEAEYASWYKEAVKCHAYFKRANLPEMLYWMLVLGEHMGTKAMRERAGKVVR